MYQIFTRKRIGPPGLLLKVLLVMRLTAILIFCTLMQVSAAGFAQKFSYSKKNASLAELFSEITKQTGYDVLWSAEKLKAAKPVSVNFKSTTLEEVLKVVLKDQSLTYSIEDRTILIKPKEPSFLDKAKSVILNLVQDLDVRGIVVDSETGQALAGASVKVKGTNRVTTTGSDGAFYLRGVDEDAVIEISFIGYVSQELKAKKDLGNIELIMEDNALDQIQVIGYGTTTKRFSTGNITTIKGETITQQPVANILQGLIGQVAGLQVTQTSGLPSSPIKIQIRGRSSIASNTEPLYIIDGIPMPSSPLPGGGISSFYTISPENIKSISVLKDADATSIYGSRAANGVILITTKKGVEGKNQLTATASVGNSGVYDMPKTLNTNEYLKLREDAFKNSGVTPTSINAPDLLSWDKVNNFNWQDWYTDNTAPYTNFSLTMNGGSKQISYNLNGNYRKEGMILPNKSNFSRANGQVGLQYTSLNNKLKVQFSSLFSNTTSQESRGSQFQMVYSEIPNYPIYNTDGTFNWIRTNHIASALSYSKSTIRTLNSNAQISYVILPGFDVTGSLGYNLLASDFVSPTPSKAKDPATSNPNGNTTFTNSFVNGWIFEPQLKYRKEFGSSTIDVLVGGTIQSNNAKQNSFTNINYGNDLLLESPNFGTPSVTSGTSSEYNYLSLFGRLTFNWKQRYVFNSTFRTDGSTRFGPNRKFGKFGSVGAGWIISDEAFFTNLKPIISFGKLRASWGTTGNDGIGDYQYISTYTNSLPYGTNPTIIPARIANSDYSWETTKKLEIGVDIGLWNDRLLFNTAWYRNRSSNQLVQYPLPLTTGFEGYIANLPAKVQNTGWELEAYLKIINKIKFKWDSGINFTVPNNKLLAFDKIENSSYAGTYVVGKSLDIVQRYHFLGVDPQNGNGLYQDVNGDNTYTARSSYNGQNGDYLIAGRLNPRWFGGLSNSIYFNKFQIDFFLQYVNQQGYNLFATNNAAVKGTIVNGWTPFLGYWKNPGDNVSIPKPLVANIDARYQNSDAGFGDASFLRLKTASISYNLSNIQCRKLKIENLKLYLQGQNIFTASNYFGFDPDISNSPFFASTPSVRTLTVGLQISL